MRFAACLILIMSLLSPVWGLKPPDDRTQRLYQLKIDEAGKAFANNDFTTANRLAAEADAIWAGQIATYNMQGAISYKLKDYEKALASFKQVLKEDSDSYTGIFNIAEVKLAQGKYDEALTGYQRLLEIRPGDEVTEFKIVVVYLLQKDVDNANRQTEAILHPGKTAAFYYAHAAIEFSAGHPAEAQKWIQRSETFFEPENATTFRDSMVERGWIKQ